MGRTDRALSGRAKVHAGSLLLLCIMVIGVWQTGCEKPRDPVQILKGFIPRIEHALNHHDFSALQSMGISPFDAGQFITDLRGPVASDTVSLRFVRVVFPRPTEAQLTLRMSKMTLEGHADRPVEIHLIEDGKWRIDGYSIPQPQPDSTGADRR